MQARCTACGSLAAPIDSACRRCGAALPFAPTTPSGDLPATATHRPSNVEIEALTEELREALAPRIVLLDLIGEGGMGRVFLAREPALRRLVAVKVLNPALVGDEVAQARFAREAETAAAVGHPGVIGIYQVGELPRSRSAYFVMQFVEGTSLEQEIRPGQGLPAGKVQRIIGEVASALAAAHARGLVHRDIKPANIMIDGETGRVVVLDFGISAVLDRNAPAVGQKLTSEGMAIGTPMYMSPEQALAQPVTAGSDVYSLGVVAFELATGRAPFRGDSWGELMAAHIKDTPPSLSSIRPDLDRPVADLIDRCLAKEAAQRPSAADLARGLLASTEASIEWPPPGLAPLRGLLLPLYASLGAISLLVFLLELLLWQQPRLTSFDVPDPVVRSLDPVPLWLFAVGLCGAFALLLVPVAGVRVSRLVERWGWGARAGYRSGVLFEVAWDHRGDVGHLLNGTGPFLLLDAADRVAVRRQRRWQALIIAATLGCLLGLPLLWVAGWLGGWVRGADVVLPSGELLLLTIPWLLGPICYFWLDRKERMVTGAEWSPLRWMARRPPPAVPPGLVTTWLESAGLAPSQAERALPMRLLELGTLCLAFGAALTGGVALWTGVSAARARDRAQPGTEALLAAAHGDSGRWMSWQALDSAVTHSAIPDARHPAADTGDALSLLASTLEARDTEAAWAVDKRASRIPPDTTAVGDFYWARTRVLRALPGRPTSADLAILAASASAPTLKLWRRIAHGGPLPALWQFRPGLPGVTRLWELPEFGAVRLYNTGRHNLDAAALDLAAGNKASALLRVRENITIGGWAMRSPLYFESFLGYSLVNSTLDPLREIARVTHDQALAAEADRLSVILERSKSGQHTILLGWGGLAADPLSPVLLSLLHDTTIAPAVRVTGMTRMTTGYCASPREILFGVDPRRRLALAQAETALQDIPRAADIVRLQRLALEIWIGGVRKIGGHSSHPFPIEWLEENSDVITRLGVCEGWY